MVAASPILLCTFTFFSFILCIHGFRGYRRKCNLPEESVFRCSSGHCLLKLSWCDGSYDCNDSSDEKYCNLSSTENCDNDDYDLFRCKSGSRCIPKEGYCDGFISCPDGSDEKNCPCEELHEVTGNIEKEFMIGEYRTHHKCWKLRVKENEKLTLSIQGNLSDRRCMFGSITLFVDADYIMEEKEAYYLEEEKTSAAFIHVICPADAIKKTFIFTTNVKILYRSDYLTSSAGYMDFLNITYSKVDRVCLDPGSIKCSENSCVSSEKQCDGTKDCENGLDEQNCGFEALSKSYFDKNRNNVSIWMRSQHDADWGWKENTHRAVVALYLGNALSPDRISQEDDLIAKQLELEVSTYLLRSTVDKLSPIELSSYINALQVICHNPRNFYGFDLVKKLKQEIVKTPGYVTPFPYLTLCNAKENVSEEVIDGLLQMLEKSSDYGFVLEVRALTIMALSCISNDNQYIHLKQNITDTLNKLKLDQKEDGSFGNVYTTALVLQALISNDQANDRDWNYKAAVEYLGKQQKADGSFGDILTTYLVMPALNAKSLVDIGKVNCTESMKRPREGNPVSDIKSRLGGKVPAKYSLVIGDEKDRMLPILLRTPENITVLELMTLAADIDPKYGFKTHQIKKKTYVYEISGIPNDPEKNKFWFLYQQVGNDPVPFSKQSPSEVHVGENFHIIMWYRTLVM